jgi:hypothetical protein
MYALPVQNQTKRNEETTPLQPFYNSFLLKLRLLALLMFPFQSMLEAFLLVQIPSPQDILSLEIYVIMNKLILY